MARLTPTLITTDCGMRLVHIHDRGAAAAIFGIAVGAGSTSDSPDGLAHFVEHTIFKGTARRTSWHIINRMEAVGGELNAYTSKEETVVYSIFPGRSATRAVELIADLAANSRFPDREIDRERQVVLDEIDSYLDTPSEAIYDRFEELLFAGSPLAHNILGTAESVCSITGADCRAFIGRHYTRRGAVAFYSGPMDADRVARLVGKYFSALPEGDAPSRQCCAVAAPHFEMVEDLHCHQTHVLTGFTTPGLLSDGRYAIALLANITGGPGMNSLLNIELRERRGLVYTVEASTAFFPGTGYTGVYFGCDAADMPLCRRLCSDVFAAIADGSAITPRRLAAAKKQYLGQLAVASENRENTVANAARATLVYGRPSSSEELAERIGAITATDLADAAAGFATASTLIFS